MTQRKPGILSHILFSAMSSGGTQIISFLTFVVLARLLGASTFGLVALAAFLIDMMQIIGSAGLSEVVVQRKDLSEPEADTAFWANLMFGGVLFALANLFAAPIANAYHQPDLTELIHALSLLFLITPLGAIHSARLTRDLRFKSLAMRTLAASLAGSMIGIPMALAGFGAWALVGQRLVTGIATMLVAWHAYRWVPGRRMDFGKLKEFVGFGGYVSASNVILQINSRVAELMSGFFVGPVAVSLIRVGARCIDMVNQITFIPIQQVSMPIQARAQHDPSMREQNYTTLSRLSATIMFPAYLGCAAMAGPLIYILFGHEWRLAGDAIRILALHVVAIQMNVLIIATLNASGHSKDVFKWSATQAVAGLLAAALASPYGWPAMLAANVVRSYLLLPLGLRLLHKHNHIHPRAVFASVRPALVSAVAMAASVMLLVHHFTGIVPAYIMLILFPAVGAAIYGILLVAQDRSILQLATAR